MLLIPNYNPSFDNSMPTCLFLDPSNFHDPSKTNVNTKKLRFSRIYAVTSF